MTMMDQIILKAEKEKQARQKKWDIYFLMEAALISTRSKDPSTKCGAVIVAPNLSIVSKGYNGLPTCYPDSQAQLENRAWKYESIVHCEVNAMIFAARNLCGHTLYTWPLLSCSRCASQLSQAGIERFVGLKNNIDRWEENLQLTKENLRESHISYTEYDKEIVLEEFKKSIDRLGQ